MSKKCVIVDTEKRMPPHFKKPKTKRFFLFCKLFFPLFLFLFCFFNERVRTLHQSQCLSFQPLFGPVVCTESQWFHLRVVLDQPELGSEVSHKAMAVGSNEDDVDKHLVNLVILKTTKIAHYYLSVVVARFDSTSI